MAGRKIRKKLNSTHGTSIFFGILFFMIASILSIVMLNGAVTAAKRVQSDKQAEQNYLTCSSAAKLLRNEIEKTAIIRKRTQTWREYDQTPNGDTIEWNSDSQTFGGIYLKDWIQNMTEDVTAGDTMTQTLQVCDSDGQLQNVTADLKITKDSSGENKFVDSEDRNRTYYGYDISINLSAGEGVDSCKMNVKLNGTVEGNTKRNGSGTSLTAVVTEVKYTWKAERIIFGADPDIKGVVQ